MLTNRLEYIYIYTYIYTHKSVHKLPILSPFSTRHVQSNLYLLGLAFPQLLLLQTCTDKWVPLCQCSIHLTASSQIYIHSLTRTSMRGVFRNNKNISPSLLCLSFIVLYYIQFPEDRGVASLYLTFSAGSSARLCVCVCVWVCVCEWVCVCVCLCVCAVVLSEG